MRRITYLALLSIVGLCMTAHAAVPRFVPYSGRLTDGTGWAQSQRLDLRFRLYACACAFGEACAAPCAEGDDGLVFHALHEQVLVQDGYFTVNLGMCDDEGRCDPNPATARFPAELPDQLWISVAVEPAGEELAPRQPVGSVAYSLSSRRAEQLEIVANGKRLSVNAVYRGHTGLLSSEYHDVPDSSFDGAGRTNGNIRFPGAGNGHRAAKAACEQALRSPTAHMCSASEMVTSAQLGLVPPSSEHLWVSSGTLALSRVATQERVHDCIGWTNGVTAYTDSWDSYGHGWEGPVPSYSPCGSVNHVACCDF